MSNFGSYTGTDFLSADFTTRDWLIENLIRERDSVLIVGESKSGKSVLNQQLTFSLTSCHPFLDKYQVSKPCKVTYIQLEGEIADLQSRYKRMKAKIEFDPAQFQLIFERPLQLQTSYGLKNLTKLIEPHNPEVIILDPLYFAFHGSLSDDHVVRQFLGNLRILKDHFDCTLILVHHTHKPRYNPKTGEIQVEGDSAFFGSEFFRAFPDHIIFITYDKKRDVRVMTCATQRSGDVAENITLKMIEPDPLYFEITDNIPTQEQKIFQILTANDSGDGLTVHQLIDLTGFGKTTVYKTLKSPLFIKIQGYPAKYKIKQ